MDVNETYCGGHFTVSTNAGSLHCKPETNKMLHVNSISIERKRPTERKGRETEEDGGEGMRGCRKSPGDGEARRERRKLRSAATVSAGEKGGREG